MPSLIDLRRRIRSVRNTQQITKAMKMVSAARLRRAQDRVLAARPYVQLLEKVLADVASAALDGSEDSVHPLLAQRPEKKIQLIVITADRGLAGAFNSNLLRAAQRFINEHPDVEIQLELIGRKGRDYFRKRHGKITGEHTGIFQKVKYEDALAISRTVMQRFADADVDAVYLAVNEFKSVMASQLRLKRILPIESPERKEQIDFIYEQPPAELLGALLPRYLETEIYRALLESAAAEHAARMTAMDAASSNAADVIDKLTLYMNRVRQASITREIIEVVSGATALE
ncbi:MAG TPA: ATP synthase F1 subunit gamma [Bryobacteraceae bacterium]|nr:ATP synthase F1 subunit gamma [Bryobacteraceae bacterium]